MSKKTIVLSIIASFTEKIEIFSISGRIRNPIHRIQIRFSQKWIHIKMKWIRNTRAGEPEPGVFGSLEPEPLEKKPGAGAAWKKSQEPEPEPLKN